MPRVSRTAVTVALVLAVLPAAAAAQREQLSLRIEQFAGADLGRVVTTSGPVSFDLRQVTVTAGHRTVRGTDDNTVLVNGVFYRWSDVGGSGTRGAIDRELHALYYDFLALRTLDDRHTLAVAVRPGLFGTLDHQLGEQFRVEGAVFVDRIVGARTTVGLGLSYTSNLGRVLPIPVVHVVHRRGRRVLVDGLLPSRLDLWYFPRKGLELGFNAQLSGFQYFLGLSSADRAARSRVGAPVALDQRLQLANAVLGPQLRWNVGRTWFVSADAGTTVLRRLTYGTGRGETALEPANAPFVRVGLQRMY